MQPCPYCHHSNPAEALYCERCGKMLQANLNDLLTEDFQKEGHSSLISNQQVINEEFLFGFLDKVEESSLSQEEDKSSSKEQQKQNDNAVQAEDEEMDIISLDEEDLDLSDESEFLEKKEEKSLTSSQDLYLSREAEPKDTLMGASIAGELQNYLEQQGQERVEQGIFSENDLGEETQIIPTHFEGSDEFDEVLPVEPTQIAAISAFHPLDDAANVAEEELFASYMGSSEFTAHPSVSQMGNSSSSTNLAASETPENLLQSGGYEGQNISFSQVPKEQTDPFIGMQLGNFRISYKIGQGGFGAVYRAEQIHLQQPFAIKVLKMNQEANDEIVERFRREARALARLKHENVVQLADFGLIEGRGFYLVMEFLEGQSLKQALKAHQDFPFLRILNIMKQICSVLYYVHRKGIAHRDLKPGNIFLVQDEIRNERVKLIDFGIAAVAEEAMSLTQEGAYLGSPLYMSPEQGRNEPVDSRSDLYALGIILYQLLTGVPPFRGENFPALLSQHLFKPPPRLEEILPERTWSPLLNDFLARVLSKQPEDRPQDASIFWNECQVALLDQCKLEPQWAGDDQGAFELTTIPVKLNHSPLYGQGSHSHQAEVEMKEPTFFDSSAQRVLSDDLHPSLEMDESGEKSSHWLIISIVLIALTAFLVILLIGYRMIFTPSHSKRHSILAQHRLKKAKKHSEEFLKKKPIIIAKSLPSKTMSSPKVSLPSEKRISSRHFPPKKSVKFYRLFIHSIPSKAEVWIKGRKVGLTPFELKGKKKSVILFILKKKKYQRKIIRWKFRLPRAKRIYKLRRPVNVELYGIDDPI